MPFRFVFCVFILGHGHRVCMKKYRNKRGKKRIKNKESENITGSRAKRSKQSDKAKVRSRCLP